MYSRGLVCLRDVGEEWYMLFEACTYGFETLVRAIAGNFDVIRITVADLRDGSTCSFRPVVFENTS
jgi:hypothetical protein